jgi:hypothetical protein
MKSVGRLYLNQFEYVSATDPSSTIVNSEHPIRL